MKQPERAAFPFIKQIRKKTPDFSNWNGIPQLHRNSYDVHTAKFLLAIVIITWLEEICLKKVNKLVCALFSDHTFLREAPSGLSRVFTPDDVSKKTWKELTARAKEVRNRLRSHKKIKVDAWTLRDKGAAYLEMLPCPLGVV